MEMRNTNTRVRVGEFGRTLSTLPVILTGCDAFTKSLRRAELTRGEMWSLALDIAMVASDSDDDDARQVASIDAQELTKRVSTTPTYHVSNFHRVDLDPPSASLTT